ncbi:Hypothetical predicted protein, partial [Paramuricea clavata]
MFDFELDKVYTLIQFIDVDRYCLAGPEALGMENGEIEDSQITSSSFIPGMEPSKGRLNAGTAWVASSRNSNQWIQVCVNESVVFTAIATQGIGDEYSRVTSYAVSYSSDGETFQVYTVTGTRKVFPGNTDGNTVVTNTITPPITARCIRIHPETWNANAYIAMRIELYGCGTHENAIYDNCVEAHQKACQA